MYNGTSIKTFIIFYWYGFVNGWNNDCITFSAHGFRCTDFFQWVCDIVFKYEAKLLTATIMTMVHGAGIWYHAPINKKEKYEYRNNKST